MRDIKEAKRLRHTQMSDCAYRGGGGTTGT